MKTRKVSSKINKNKTLTKAEGEINSTVSLEKNLLFKAEKFVLMVSCLEFYNTLKIKLNKILFGSSF